MGFPGFAWPARPEYRHANDEPFWRSPSHYRRYVEARAKWLAWADRAAELRARVTWGGSDDPASDWHSAWWCLVLADECRREMEWYYSEGEPRD